MSLLASFAPDLQGYSRQLLAGDLTAGIVTGIVAIPLSLGLAIATGVPPIWGLYTAVVAGALAAVFAGSPYSVSGPAAAMIPILVPIIDHYGLDSFSAIGLLAGVFLVIFGLLNLGNLIRYVPPSVTYGFTAGIAVIIFAGQLNSFFGLQGVAGGEHFHEKIWITLSHLPTLDLPTLLIGLLSLTFLIGLPFVPGLRVVPASLVAVTVGILLSSFVPYFGSVTTIADAFGTIQLGLPPLTWPSLGGWYDLVGPAFKVALLVTVESLLCAVIADKMTSTRHKSNQELIAQGVANLATPFFSGMPATAVIARTGTSVKNGAKTRLAALIHALVVLLFLLVAAPVGSQIPLTVLSAILFITAWKISEAEHIQHLVHTAPRADLVVLVITFLLTVFLDLTISVTFGLAISTLIIFRKLSTIHATDIGPDSSFVNETVRQALAEHRDVQFINLEGNLSMGFGGSLLDVLPLRETARKIILRFREVQHIDLSGLEALAELVTQLKKSGHEIHFTSFNQSNLIELRRFGLLARVDSVHDTTTDAIRAMYPGGERRRADRGAPAGVPDRRAAR